MRLCPDCLPCLTKILVDLARKSSRGQVAVEREILQNGLRLIGQAAGAGFLEPPPCLLARLHNEALVRSWGAVPDPWAAEKAASTELARRILSRLSSALGWRPDEFASRLRLSVGGNALDCAVYGDAALDVVGEKIDEVLSAPLDPVPVARLKKLMDEAKSILWMFDNCGESVFDRLLIEPYREKVTLCVRGKPVLNDMTRAELAASGYPPGWAGGGVVEAAFEGFPPPAMQRVDLVVAKGLANFEMLDGRTNRPTAFLFLVKCDVLSRLLTVPKGSVQVRFANVASAF